MASAVNGVGGSSSNTTNSTSLGAAPSEDEFLQLLVAQLQNQDPMNPTDSTQFVSELAQFSELDQVMAIRSDIESYHTQATTTTTPSTTDGASSTDSSTNGSASTNNTNGTTNTTN